MASSIGVAWNKEDLLIAVGISQITLVRDGQFMKQSFPRKVTDAGMETDVSAKQLLKQVSPTLVTDEGMTMELSAKQLLKQSLSK